MKPLNAACVWLEDSILCVELPGIGELSHTIKLPDGEWDRLFTLLRQRGPETKIGEPGDPTQWQLYHEASILLAKEFNGKVRKVGKPKTEVTVEQRSKIDEILREMGLCT